jgi:hypothetical protein
MKRSDFWGRSQIAEVSSTVYIVMEVVPGQCFSSWTELVYHLSLAMLNILIQSLMRIGHFLILEEKLQWQLPFRPLSERFDDPVEQASSKDRRAKWAIALTLIY